MTKKELEKAYSKALKAGYKMLEDAQRYDSLANENPSPEQAIQQRFMATFLRDLYSKLFD